jgi:hypothetical protein
MPIFSSDVDPNSGIRGAPGARSATGGKYLSSLFSSSQKKLDSPLSPVVLRRSPSPSSTSPCTPGEVSPVHTRESDVNAFRPSFLNPDCSLENNLTEPLLIGSSLHDGALNFSFQPAPTIVQGCVALSPEVYRSLEAERLEQEQLLYNQRWEIFDPSLYEKSPVLFVVVHFNVVQEPRK